LSIDDVTSAVADRYRIERELGAGARPMTDSRPATSKVGVRH
jgi:hypothetical protein